VNGDPVGTDSPQFTTDALNDGDEVACTVNATDPCTGNAIGASDVVQVAVNTILSITGGVDGPESACAGDALTYAIEPVTGVETYTWTLPADWTGSSTSNIINVVAGETGGTVSVTADNECGSSSPVTIDVSSFPNHATLSGGVTLGSVPVVSGWVFVYLQNQPTEWWETTGTKVDSAEINFGNYSFDEMEIYDEPFILKAIVTGDQSPFTVPTYYAVDASDNDSSSPTWNDSDLNYDLTLSCGADETRNISIIEVPELDGDASLSGTVFWGTPGKMAAEDPIPGVDVVVEKIPPGNTFSHNETDAQGFYEFVGVPAIPTSEFYRIFIVFPGIPLIGNGHEVIVTPEDDQFTDLNFYVDTVLGQILAQGATGVETLAEEMHGLMYMPNPMADHMTVLLKEGTADATGYRIRSLSGQVIVSKEMNSVRSFKVERSGLSSGLYLLETYLTDGQRVTTRVAVQ